MRENMKKQLQKQIVFTGPSSSLFQEAIHFGILSRESNTRQQIQSQVAMQK